mgnify:CR=1 FL=1
MSKTNNLQSRTSSLATVGQSQSSAKKKASIQVETIDSPKNEDQMHLEDQFEPVQEIRKKFKSLHLTTS